MLNFIQGENYKFFEKKTLDCPYLKTMGDGTQNLMSVFLMLSCSVASSKHQDVCSLADAPAVGSLKDKMLK